MKAETREALITAIAKARGWIDDIRLGRIASFADSNLRMAESKNVNRRLRSAEPLRTWISMARSCYHNQRCPVTAVVRKRYALGEPFLF
jgi:hypothetical protein